jgi:hypothetical protein
MLVKRLKGVRQQGGADIPVCHKIRSQQGGADIPVCHKIRSQQGSVNVCATLSQKKSVRHRSTARQT